MKKKEKIISITLDHFPHTLAIYLFGSFGTPDELPQSDADIALLFSHREAKQAGSLAVCGLRNALGSLLEKEIDLINLRLAPTVLQKEIVVADRCIYCADKLSVDEFEMLTYSFYQKLNEERRGIIQNAIETGSFLDI